MFDGENTTCYELENLNSCKEFETLFDNDVQNSWKSKLVNHTLMILDFFLLLFFIIGPVSGLK